VFVKICLTNSAVSQGRGDGLALFLASFFQPRPQFPTWEIFSAVQLLALHHAVHIYMYMHTYVYHQYNVATIYTCQDYFLSGCVCFVTVLRCSRLPYAVFDQVLEHTVFGIDFGGYCDSSGLSRLGYMIWFLAENKSGCHFCSWSAMFRISYLFCYEMLQKLLRH